MSIDEANVEFVNAQILAQKAQAIATLAGAGFDHGEAAIAVEAGDLSLLTKS